MSKHHRGIKGWSKTRLAVLERDNYICYACGGDADQVDHLVPVSKGGSSTVDNLAAMCAKCNNDKLDAVLTREAFISPRWAVGGS